MTKNKKSTWNVMQYGWIGKASSGVDEFGCRWYRPGERMGWSLVRSFASAAEADEWLCDKCRNDGWLITDFTIKRA